MKKQDKLSGSQLFLAGTIMTKLSEEIKESINDGADKNTEKAMKYILTKFDEINKEIAEKLLAGISERMKEIHKLMNEE